MGVGVKFLRAYCFNDVKGEVRAICRFSVFDGNGLLGHRLIDSRWFEKNPPTESGWKRRSKKRPRTGISRGNDRGRNMCFQVRAISSRLWFIYIFAFASGSLSIAGGWRKCGTLLNFCQTVVLVCPLLLQEEQEARVKGFAAARFRKKPENWSIWQTAHGYVATEGPRLCSGKLACTFSLRTNASSSVPSLHFLATISSWSFLAPRSSRSTPDRQTGVLNDRRCKPSSLRREANDGRQRETGTKTWK